MAQARLDVSDVGPFNDQLPFFEFVDDHTILMKSGQVAMTFAVKGVDFERLDRHMVAEVTKQFTSATRQMEGVSIYQYVIRDRAPQFTAAAVSNPVAHAAIQARVHWLNTERAQTLYHTDLFMALVMDGVKPRRRTTLTRQPGVGLKDTLAHWLSARTVHTVLDTEIRQAAARLRHVADHFERALDGSAQPRRLEKPEAYRFLRRLCNVQPHKIDAPLLQDDHLDYYVCDSAIDNFVDHATIDDQIVKVLTMKATPSKSFGNMLKGLLAIQEAEMIACLEWQRFDRLEAVTHLTSAKTHFETQNIKDPSGRKTAKQLEDVITDVQTADLGVGRCALTVLLHDRHPKGVEQAVAAAIKVLASQDGAFYEETLNLPDAWQAMMPGNQAKNRRYQRVLDENLADLSLALFTLDRGDPWNAHLNAESLMVLETPSGTPIHINTHVGDVGHKLIVGETGSGKSYLSNAELTHLLKYDPEITIIDAGHSYRKYADAMGGSFIELGVDKKVQLNPFSLTPTASNLEFLKKFVQMLLEGPGTQPLTDWEHRVVFEAIKRLYKNDPEHRRLFDLRWSLPDALQDRLAPWVEGGQYDMFDHVDDTLALRGQIRVLELEAMKKLPQLRDALLLYVLHRIDEQVRGGVLTVIWMEEVAFLAEHPVLRDYINDVLTMGRKRNMMMVLVAQHIGQLKKSGLQRTALSACLTKYILANPNMDKQDMRDLFGLNDVELQMCLTIAKKKQFVIMRPGSTKLVELTDPANHWLYSPDESSRDR